MLRFISILGIVFFLFSCKKETKLEFSDRTFSSKKNAVILVNFPKAEGPSSVAKKINATLEEFVCKAFYIDAAKPVEKTIETSAKQFDSNYTKFKEEISKMLSEALPVWEALVDGEISYKNENLISIAMNSSINTGTAKGNLKIKFYNFDPITGNQLTVKELINNEQKFKQLVKKYYDKELLTNYNNAQISISNKDFKYPETIGFSDDGVIIFYNNYELLLPAYEVLEFTIPYSVANPYLTF